MKIIIIYFVAIIMVTSLSAQKQGIINNSESPHVTLRSRAEMTVFMPVVWN